MVSVAVHGGPLTCQIHAAYPQRQNGVALNDTKLLNPFSGVTVRL
jgi:hypothetical protein